MPIACIKMTGFAHVLRFSSWDSLTQRGCVTGRTPMWYKAFGWLDLVRASAFVLVSSLIITRAAHADDLPPLPG
jgi:hypothetical protein